jgi:hypothetical protein
MSRLAELLPNLEYINIANCKGLNTFPLLRFSRLKYAIVSEGMYNHEELKKMRRKINVHVEPPQ